MDRLKPVLPPERIWILTNDHLRAEIVKQLPEVPARQIIAEPAQRNTAPAIGLAAHLIHQSDPNAVMGVFPADHVISKPREYVRLVRPAFQAARRDTIVVLGIQPRWAETGYGYIEFPPGIQPGGKESVAVSSFREKPLQPTAEKFLAAGNFYWNAGMFFWKTKTVLDALRRHLPNTAALLDSVPALGHKTFKRKLNELFPKMDNISIDYAVLERADNVVGIPAGDIGWNDVGSWNAVYELHPRDTQGNAARSEVLLHHASGNYVDAHGKLAVLLGVKDLVIVDTPDALLIADRSRAQQVGDIVKLLEKHGREELL